jgi:hypothetical protein
MKVTKQQLKKIIREEMEQMKLQDLQPQVDALYDVVQREMHNIPLESRGIVLQAVTEKMSAPPEQDVDMQEVSSEKQRRWACAQKDKPASERAQSLSAEEADEMCKSKVESKMMSDRPVGNPEFPPGHPFAIK